MRLRKPSLIQLSLPLLFLQVLWLIPVFAKDKPEINRSKLDGFPNGLFYFEDSNTILLLNRKSRVVQITTDAGVHWKPIDEVKKGHAWDILPHPFDKNVAYILGGETQHWVTKDQGKEWKMFETEAPPFGIPMSFHASDPDKVIIHVLNCRSFTQCDELDYYTTDGFESKPSLLREDTKNCVFADSTPQFKENGDGHPKDRIICIVLGRLSSLGRMNSPWSKDHRIVVSDNFFKDKEEMEPKLDGSHSVKGIIKMAVVKGFILAAAKAENTVELALYVTKDAKNWHRAEFPSEHRLNEDAYTILESTNYSIQVDVMTTDPPSPMGVLFTSNSNGTYFTKNIGHTNRNKFGNVDFEKIQGVQGIFLVNTVENYKKIEEQARLGRGSEEKKVQTKISFHDGRYFRPIKSEGDDLHLHSITDISNFGKVYSSPAPGLVMGVGNTGEYLKEYAEGDLYVSDDAGVSWARALRKAHKYEFGGQGAILVAVLDEGPTDEIAYSIDHGKTWKTEGLGEKVVAKVLTTTPDSTSLKFLLIATVGERRETENFVYAIDFEGLHERECEEKDFENWPARLDEKGNPDCLMGSKQFYRRRKADAECFVGKEFIEPLPSFEPCSCREEDFECDFNFVRSDDGKECVRSGRLPIPEGECKKSDNKFQGSSGYRLIPGNKCIRKDGIEMDKEKDWPCEDSIKQPASGKISSQITEFRGNKFMEYYYLERTSSSRGHDQTVVMRTNEHEIWMTKDHGKNWRHILKDEKITAIYPHQYHNDAVYFLTGGDKVHYTVNRGDTFEEFACPKGGPTHNQRLQALGFHAGNPNWLIWTGADGCSAGSESECHDVAYITEDRGYNWKPMLRYVRKCEFIRKQGRGGSEKLVYCEQYEKEKLDSPLLLVSSENWFSTETEKKTRFKNIVDFATMSEFIIVAAKDNDYLKVDASVDGKTFANALFPPNFKVFHQKAYTVLDSSTHAVFLHVTVQTRPGGEYGSIMKSNSNGTSYVLSLNGVNRDASGYVDFEKILGLQGVALANVVANLEDVEKGEHKKLKTKITHNDGAQWSLLKAPALDAEGHKYKCDVEDIEHCSLQLHAYTERDDPRNTYSSTSAIGLMMAVGNVWEHLEPKAEGETFISSDGGISWRAVRKGSYMWEYGNQGSIIVIVEENKATRQVQFTRDEGHTWDDYQFSESDVIVTSISSVPSDNSREFLLWGKEAGGSNKIVTVNLDFTGLTDRECELDKDHPTDGDYELWTPKHPMQKDDCLFGQVTRFYRKKSTSECYNGENFEILHNVTMECECTRQDFEWYVESRDVFGFRYIFLFLRLTSL